MGLKYSQSPHATMALQGDQREEAIQAGSKNLRAHFLSVGNIQRPRKAKSKHTDTLKRIKHHGVSFIWLCLFLCLRAATLNPAFYHLIQILSWDVY